MNELITSAVQAHFPESLVSISKGALGSDLYVKVFIASSKDEFMNGISQNDPLSLMFSIDDNNTVEFHHKSFTINPDEPYYAYGRHRVNVRKIKAKSQPELSKKLGAAIAKFKEEGIKLYSEGKFTVYTYEPLVNRLEKLFSK